MLHCEVCGTGVAALAGARYCLECGLYVCLGCWRERRRRCRECVDADRGPSGRGASVLTARRADRRLREVVAAAAAVPSTSAPVDDDDSVFVRSSLHVKASTAAHIGRASLARLTGTPARRRLAARIESNAARAEAAVRRHATSPTRESAMQRPVPPRRLAAWLTGVATAAAVAAIVVVVLPNIIDSSDGTREQTLAGLSASSDRTGLPTAQPSARQSASPAAEPPSPSASPTIILAVAFDELTMNSGLGAEWAASGDTDAVEVAPIPNAVNRSARLVTSGSFGAEACTELAAATGELTVTVDVMVSGGAARADVSLDAAPGRLTASYTAERSTLSGAGMAPLQLDGISPGEWYRSVISVRPGGEWELTALEKDPVEQSALMGNPTGIGPPRRICIGVEGEAGASAHFDNLTITAGRKNS